MRFVLASKSPARLDLLRRAGLDPEVIVSGVDESVVTDPVPMTQAAKLAQLKGEAVVGLLDGDFVLLACDSVLEFEGRSRGKPGTAQAAIDLWLRMRGQSGLVHTGHFVVVSSAGKIIRQTRVGTTKVQFADISEDEIKAYAATGEPQRVAGGFSIDKRGAAFITSVTGDPFNVSGVALPMLRQMVIDAGVPWHQLWV